MKLIRLLLFALLLPSSATFAEPTDTVRKLMNEPMSLFDWGIYQLGEFAKSRAEYIASSDWPDGGSTGGAAYDWDANRIYVTFTLYVDEPSKESCVKWANRVLRHTFLSKPATGEIRKAYSGILKRYFGHTGYTSPRLSESIGEELGEITQARFFVHKRGLTDPGDDGLIAPLSTCYSDYGSGQILLQK